MDASTVRSIQIRCVIRVLEETMDNVKSALLLPKLLSLPQNAFKVLIGSKYEPGKRLVDDYMRRRQLIVKKQQAPLSDQYLIRILDYFHRNPDVFNMFPDVTLTPEDHQMLNIFALLLRISKIHLNRSSKTEINQERLLQKVYQKNEKLKDTIIQLQATLESQKSQMESKLTTKEVYLQKCEQALELQQKEHLRRIESERCVRMFVCAKNYLI